MEKQICDFINHEEILDCISDAEIQRDEKFYMDIVDKARLEQGLHIEK